MQTPVEIQQVLNYFEAVRTWISTPPVSFAASDFGPRLHHPTCQRQHRHVDQAVSLLKSNAEALACSDPRSALMMGHVYEPRLRGKLWVVRYISM